MMPKELFNRLSATLLLSLGVTASAATPAESAPPQPTSTCAAFPDFQKPEFPMHRISRNIDPDPVIEYRQDLLRQIGIASSKGDGRIGMNARMQMREFLTLYGTLYNQRDTDHDLDDQDTRVLEKYARLAQIDAKKYDTTPARAAAARLASERTGIDIRTVLDANKPDTPSAWLDIIHKTGGKYGLGFYAEHISLDKNGMPQVENPFIYRQILGLRSNPRLMMLMSAEASRPENAPAFQTALPRATPSPLLKARQKALQDIGFETGNTEGTPDVMTDISIREFQVLYGNGTPTGKLSPEEEATLAAAAARAQAEASLFDVPTRAAGAIRMAAQKNNTDFGYMMELASAESGFSHDIKASTSSATGLYQFIESTWHTMIASYGGKYALGDLSGQVTIYMDDYGRQQARMANPFIRQQTLELRKHPALSSLFGTDFQNENLAKQQCYVDGGISRTDRYLAHFLGAHDSIYFINQMRQQPDKSSVATFPEAAEYNEPVFYDMKGKKTYRERSLSEVFSFFDKKFNRGVFENGADVQATFAAASVKSAVTDPEVPAKSIQASKPSHRQKTSSASSPRKPAKQAAPSKKTKPKNKKKPKH